ncbi:hypothetical protein KSP40_PGU000113 [Platanthera guangdongensis]|uniref:Uncharacterized protein n=1 Tax=Platanthera guangdongensis TaxID=2320717 RepID=A0ABR2ML65_9ASPA
MPSRSTPQLVFFSFLKRLEVLQVQGLWWRWTWLLHPMPWNRRVQRPHGISFYEEGGLQFNMTQKYRYELKGRVLEMSQTSGTEVLGGPELDGVWLGDGGCWFVCGGLVGFDGSGRGGRGAQFDRLCGEREGINKSHGCRISFLI